MADKENQKPEEAGCFAIGCSFLWPIIGIIIYFSQKDKVSNPSAYLKAAGISVILTLLMMIITAGFK